MRRQPTFVAPSRRAVRSSSPASVPQIHQREQVFRIARVEAVEVGELAHVVTHLEPQIPQRMQQRFDEPLFGPSERTAEDHEQIDVRMKKLGAAAVPTHGTDRHRRPGVDAGTLHQLPDDRRRYNRRGVRSRRDRLRPARWRQRARPCARSSVAERRRRSSAWSTSLPLAGPIATHDAIGYSLGGRRQGVGVGSYPTAYPLRPTAYA